MKVVKDCYVPKENDLVWAKMRYCSFWPARLTKTPRTMGKTPVNKICVFFFGTKQFGFVDVNNVHSYKEHREKFMKKGRGIWFKNSIVKIDEFISDPKTFHVNAYTEDVDMITENDIEKSLGIKREPMDSGYEASQLKQNQPKLKKDQVAQSQQEKQSLIDTIVSLKAENQKNMLCLKQTQNEITLLKVEKTKREQELMGQIKSTTVELNEFKLKFMNISDEFSQEKLKNEKAILELKREKKILQARLEQYDSGTRNSGNLFSDEKYKESDSDNDENVFEVEKLVGDKLVNGVKYYRVKWKNYNSTYNTWETENNLTCPLILKKYNQQKYKK